MMADLAGFAIVVIFLVGMGCLINLGSPKNSPWISEGHKPDPNCNDCFGTGILNEGNDHLEMDCHCTDRYY